MNGGHAVHEAVRAFVERRGAWTLAAGPLPSNVLDVLKLAARAGDKLDQWSLDLNIPPQRLTEIAGSFIENVLITPEASHYRVLGVAPDASEARITVHYNWLMQWLRVGGHTPEIRAELASRIKAAYRELSDVARRAAYDAAMSEALAARLEHVIQPAQYDPRKTPGPGPRAATPPPRTDRRVPSPPAVKPEPPVAFRLPAPAPDEPAPTADEEDWRTETIVLETPEPVRRPDIGSRPAREAPPESRSDHVIELPRRPAPVPTVQPPVRRRLPLALLLALGAAAALFATRGQWLPWLEGRLATPVAEQGPEPAGPGAAAPAAVEAPAPRAATQPPPAIEVRDAEVEVAAPPEAAVTGPADLPADTAEEPLAAEPGTPDPPATAPAAAGPDAAEPAPSPVEQPVVADSVVPAEARTAARRVADAYASGDVVAVVNAVNREGRLSQPELAAVAADVERWWLERAGLPLTITATRVLPPLNPGDGDRAAVELRAPDDAGLRVILQREGLFWQVQDVLTIAPTASRNGAAR